MASSQFEVASIGAQHTINVQSGRVALWDSFVTPSWAATNGTINALSGCTEVAQLLMSCRPAAALLLHLTWDLHYLLINTWQTKYPEPDIFLIGQMDGFI